MAISDHFIGSINMIKTEDNLIMKEKKKVFLKPIAEIIDFDNDDIITLSGVDEGAADMNDDDNVEPF